MKSDKRHLNADGTFGVFNYNADFERRETLLAQTERGKEGAGIRSFSGMSAETLTALVTENFTGPDEAQNGSPTVAAFLTYMQQHPGVTAIGYDVPPERSDYRVSVEGIVLAKPYTPEQEEDFRAFCDEADELFESDSEYGRGLRAWWD